MVNDDIQTRVEQVFARSGPPHVDMHRLWSLLVLDLALQTVADRLGVRRGDIEPR